MAYSNIMVDIETFGLAPGSAIRSIAALPFDPVTNMYDEANAFKIAIDLDSHSMAVDPATLSWWNSQPPEAHEQFANPIALLDALVAFRDWWDGMNESADKPCRFWAKSPSFDSVLLKAAYDHVGMTPSWTYRDEFDVRTIYRVCHDYEAPMQGVKHDAMADCIHQVGMVGMAFQKLGLA